MSYPPVSPGEPPASDQPPYAPQPPYTDPLAAPPPPAWSPPSSPPSAYPPPEPPTTIQPTPPPSYSSAPPPPPPYAPGPPQPPMPPQPPYPGAPGYPTSAPPYGQPPTSYPSGAGVAPPPKKSNKTLFIVLGIVGALLLLCCVGGAAFFLVRANDVRQAIDTGPVEPGPYDPGNNDPGNNDPGQNGANFDMAVGKTATITDEDGSFTLTLVSAKWHNENCDDNSFFPPPDGKILVLDVTFEVKSGVASINPLFFDFRDSGGRTADISFFSGCDEPMLDSGNNLRAGTKRSGKLAFDVTGGQNGTLEYQNSFEPAASWKITA
jgi:Domain of unknown function (DUF4352)